MKTKTKIFAAVIVIMMIVLITACNLPDSATKKDSKHNCPTSVSGQVHYKVRQEKEQATLRRLRWLADKYIDGKIVEKTKEGYLFAKYNHSTDSYQEPVLYKFEDIVYVVDEQQNLVYGNYEKYKEKYLTWYVYFIVKEINDTSGRRISFSAYPDEPFSYCLEPGKYNVDFLELIMKHYTTGGKYRHTHFYSDCIFESGFILDVKADKSNYIGDLYLDSLAAGDGVLPLDMKVNNRYDIDNRLYMYINNKDTAFVSDKKDAVNRHTLIIKDESIKHPNTEPAIMRKK